MKRIFVAFFLFCCFAIFAEIVSLGFEPKKFDDSLYLIGVYDTMMQKEVEECESQSYDYAFVDKADKYESRYIMFSETKKIDDIKQQVGLWSYMVIQNIAGDEAAVRSTTSFNDSDVKKEFNADYGLTSFIQNGTSDFCAGYKYIMLNFFYKKNVGIMCQAILFNDVNFIKTNEFMALFHTFKYY